MTSQTQAAEKAEFIQSVKALFIPLSLFLSCVGMAAGMFLIYSGEPVGWVFAAISGSTVIVAFVALIRFQNKYRAGGIIRSNFGEDAEQDSELDFEPESLSAVASADTITTATSPDTIAAVADRSNRDSSSTVAAAR